MKPSLAAFWLVAAGCGGAQGGGEGDGASAPGGGEEAPAGGAGLGAEWVTKGEAAYREGNVERAKGAFERALRLAPDDPGARVGMALVDMATLEFAAAARRLEGVLDSNAPALRVMAAWLGGDVPTACRLAGALGAGRGGAPGLVTALCENAPEAAYRFDGTQQASLPLATDAPLPVVVVRIDGRPARLLIDTGAAETILDPRFAGEGRAKWIRDLELATITVHDVPAFVKDISPLARGLQTELDGILGLEVLRRAFCTLDYLEGWLLVRRDRSDARPEAVEVPFHLFLGRYLSVPMKIEDAEPAPMLVASGGTFAVGLTDAALRASGRDPAALRREQDGMARYGLRSVGIGRLTLTDVPAVHFVFPTMVAEDAHVDFAGVISQQLLANFRVTLDPERRVMAFEPGPDLGE